MQILELLTINMEELIEQNLNFKGSAYVSI